MNSLKQLPALEDKNGDSFVFTSEEEFTKEVRRAVESVVDMASNYCDALESRIKDPIFQCVKCLRFEWVKSEFTGLDKFSADWERQLQKCKKLFLEIAQIWPHFAASLPEEMERVLSFQELQDFREGVYYDLEEATRQYCDWVVEVCDADPRRMSSLKEYWIPYASKETGSKFHLIRVVKILLLVPAVTVEVERCISWLTWLRDSRSQSRSDAVLEAMCRIRHWAQFHGKLELTEEDVKELLVGDHLGKPPTRSARSDRGKKHKPRLTEKRKALEKEALEAGKKSKDLISPPDWHLRPLPAPVGILYDDDTTESSDSSSSEEETDTEQEQHEAEEARDAPSDSRDICDLCQLPFASEPTLKKGVFTLIWIPCDCGQAGWCSYVCREKVSTGRCNACVSAE